MKIAVVTGASSGMGREFALRLDAEYPGLEEIWVIARREDRLEMLKGKIKSRVVPLCLDMRDASSAQVYAERLRAENPDVRVLVNAAGYGKFGACRDVPTDELTGMIDLNARALTEFTLVTLPYMSRGSHIYQLGSLSAFQPVPYFGVYAAAKAYVLSFSRALNKELEKEGIRVMAVCPGWVDTEFIDKASRDNKAVSRFGKIAEAQQVITRAFRDMRRGKDVSVFGFSIRAQVLAVKILPHRLVMKIWCKQQNK
ncbi:MAG: SDR family NAD(P)-dependent oxidoreductase [Eubacteriales bacterium]